MAYRVFEDVFLKNMKPELGKSEAFPHYLFLNKTTNILCLNKDLIKPFDFCYKIAFKQLHHYKLVNRNLSLARYYDRSVVAVDIVQTWYKDTPVT